MIGTKMERKMGRSVGDSTFTVNHPTKNIFLNRVQAQALCNIITDEMRWPHYNVDISDRVVKHRYATVWPAERRMVFYEHIGGNNVHCLLHELSHHIAPKHDNHFKKVHSMLTCLWEKLHKEGKV